MKLLINKIKYVPSILQLYATKPTRTSLIHYSRSFSNETNEDVARAPLYDLHGRRHNYLRISLTERCNLRCQYCMPAEGVQLSSRAALLTRAELARLVRVFASLGVDKLRLTGGEPTLRADLADVIRELRGVAGIRSVALTTNGLALARRLPALQAAGLGALNVSLDSLRAARYEAMARRAGLARVLAAVDLALQLGYRPVKINTVLMKGFNDDEICDFVEYTRDREVEVRFIEFMPFSGNQWGAERMVPHRDVLRAVRAEHPGLRPRAPRPHDTAEVWQVPGYAGSVGFISSMTQHFCKSCNRLRLTADGNLKVCLFGAGEVSLREALRAGASDEQLAGLVRAALRNKRPAHAARAGAGGRGWGPRHPLARAGAPRPGLAGPARPYCSRPPHPPQLTHLDGRGRARMVDVGPKPVSARSAEAECRLLVGARLLRLLRDRALPKGEALTVAEVAGVLAAKRTSELIPLCHPLPLEMARVEVSLPEEGQQGQEGRQGQGGVLRVRCSVRVTARTGAEMEALTGAAVAALTLYDMCKAVDKDMRITDLRLVRKTGGKGAQGWQGSAAETFAPTNFPPL